MVSNGEHKLGSNQLLPPSFHFTIEKSIRILTQQSLMKLPMNFDHLNKEQKLQLIQYMRGHVTEHKQRVIQEVLPLRTRHLTVVLENIFQRHNASAVLRSCECFGVQDVHIIENEYPYRISRDVARGATKWLTLHRYEAAGVLQTCLSNLKEQGYTIAAATLRPEAISIRDVDIHKKLALCFGTEKKGLSDTAHQLADLCIQIPMDGFTDSFNVSVSAALCLYELTNRLRASEAAWRLSEAEQLELMVSWLVKSTKYGRPLLRHFYEAQGWPIPAELDWDKISPANPEIPKKMYGKLHSER